MNYEITFSDASYEGSPRLGLSWNIEKIWFLEPTLGLGMYRPDLIFHPLHFRLLRVTRFWILDFGFWILDWLGLERTELEIRQIFLIIP